MLHSTGLLATLFSLITILCSSEHAILLTKDALIESKSEIDWRNLQSYRDPNLLDQFVERYSESRESILAISIRHALLLAIPIKDKQSYQPLIRKWHLFITRYSDRAISYVSIAKLYDLCLKYSELDKSIDMLAWFIDSYPRCPISVIAKIKMQQLAYDQLLERLLARDEKSKARVNLTDCDSYLDRFPDSPQSEIVDGIATTINIKVQENDVENPSDTPEMIDYKKNKPDRWKEIESNKKEIRAVLSTIRSTYYLKECTRIESVINSDQEYNHLEISQSVKRINRLRIGYEIGWAGEEMEKEMAQIKYNRTLLDGMQKKIISKIDASTNDLKNSIKDSERNVISQMDKHFFEVKQQLVAINSNISELRKKVDEIDKKVDNIAKIVDGLSKEIKEIKENVAKIDGKLDDLKKDIKTMNDNMNTGFENISKQITALDEKLTTKDCDPSMKGIIKQNVETWIPGGRYLSPFIDMSAEVISKNGPKLDSNIGNARNVLGF